MSKNLYTMRYSDGRLMRYNGLSWATVGTYTPSSWPADVHRRVNGGCMVYRGKLYTRYLDDSTVCHVEQLHPTTGANQASLTVNLPAIDGGYNRNQFWGPTFEYKGQLQWFVVISNDPYRSYLYLFTLKDNGSGGTTLTFRRCDELGSSTDTNQFGGPPYPLCAMPRVVGCRDRLFMSGSGVGGSSGWLQVWDQNGQLDMDKTSGLYSLTGTIDGRSSRRVLQFSDSQLSGDSKITLNDIYNSTVGFGVFRGDVYQVTPSGKVFKFNPVTSARTQIWDYCDVAYSQVNGGSTYTQDYDLTGNTSYTFFMNIGSQLWYPVCDLCRVTITNYNGTPGLHKTGYSILGNDHGMSLIDDTTGSVLPAQPVGTTFTVSWGMGGTYLDGESSYTRRVIYGFEYNSKLYMIAASGRGSGSFSTQSDGASRTPPFLLSTYDGTSTSHTQYTNGGAGFSSAGFGFTEELDNNILHMFMLDQSINSVVHYKFDLTATPPTLTSVATMYSRPNDNAQEEGMLLDSVVSFDAGDITAHMESISFNQGAGTTTTTYKLFGANADTANTLKFEYNTGSGWNNATNKTGSGSGTSTLVSSASGTQYTFVHDLATDLTSGFSGTIQYRISITSQTRN